MLKGTKVGYKVVSVTPDGKLLSWKARGEYNRVGLFGNVEYMEGDWTLRVVGDGPLTVFNTYKNALDFKVYYAPKTNNLKCKIFKVVYMSSKSKRTWYFISETVNGELLLHTGGGVTCVDGNLYTKYPAGTQFADAVFLSELLFEDK